MNKYKFRLSEWSEEESFYCLAENIFFAFLIFEYFCVCNDVTLKSVVVEEVECADL